MTNEDRNEFFGMCVRMAAITRADMDEPTQHLYFRAMRDVPMDLVRRSAVELAKTATFMPKPAEWRQAVDRVIDSRQVSGSQPLLPGEIGDYRCESCDNTGFVSSEQPCNRGPKCAKSYKAGESHTHTVATRCQDALCSRHRAILAQRKRRYSRSED